MDIEIRPSVSDWLLLNPTGQLNRAFPPYQPAKTINEKELFIKTFLYYQRFVNGRCVQQSFQANITPAHEHGKGSP